MKLRNESDILDEAFRKIVISEILGEENIQRKNKQLRKHEIYRDMNQKWVLDALAKESFKPSTLKQMENRSTNVSVCRKIVNKLAQAYTGGVSRMVINDEVSEFSINELAKYLDFDSVMKKLDRYRQLFRNTQLMILPRVGSLDDNGDPIYYLSMRVLAPWEYDVIENPDDLTQAKCVILTDFTDRSTHEPQELSGDATRASQGFRTGFKLRLTEGDQVDQVIADSPEDKGAEKREFIWWSDLYHFTTDVHGRITKSPDGSINPIEKLPFINITGDQDGNFWAAGGDDVVEGSVLINKLLTDVNFISFVQGWGQLVITGKDLPNRIEGGPDNALTFDVREGDPNPSVFYATSNPPIQNWLETIKMTLAMVLSTNDLSAKSISASLDSSNAASGIAMLIDQSEITASLQDVQKVFQDKEPVIWEVIRLWHLLYSSQQQLEDDLQEIPIFSSSKVKVKFHQVKPLISEKEKLEVLKMRKDLGLNTQAELIQMDNPDLTTDEAEARALANTIKPIVEPLIPEVNNVVEPLIPEVNDLDVVQP